MFFVGAVQIDNNEVKIDMEEGIATAEVVNFFNDLFDSVNSSEVKDNDLRSPVVEDSVHHVFWTNAKGMLRNLSYVDKVTRELIKSVPSLKNWLLTIDGFEKIWKIIHSKYEFTSFKTRYCNQDPIENFFGQIRSHAVRNTNPTPKQFEDSFITLLVSNMKSVSIVGGNCEASQDSFMLFSLEEYLEDNLSNVEVSDDNEPHEMFTTVVVSEESSTEFLPNYLDEVITVIVKELNYCEECNDSLKSNEFSVFAKQIVRRIIKLLDTRSYRRNILKVLLEHFETWNVDTNWHMCIEHHYNIFKVTVRVISIKTLIWWCKKKFIDIKQRFGF